MNEVVKHTASLAGSMLDVIARAATDERVNIDKMTALFDMQQRIMAKDALDQFNEAMAEFNARCELRVAKAGTASLGGKGSYRFARWEDMDVVIRPIMRELGLWFSFDATTESNGVTVKGTLHHRGGHTQSASLSLPVDVGPGRNAIQQVGSTVSYGKRYCVEMLLNVVREDEDDDGHAGGATRRPPPPRQEPEREKTFEERAEYALTNEPDPRKWLRLLETILSKAETAAQVSFVRRIPSVMAARKGAPGDAQLVMDKALTAAVDRLSPKPDPVSEVSTPTSHVEGDLTAPLPSEDDFILIDHIKEEMAELTELSLITRWCEGAGRTILGGLKERSPKLWTQALEVIDTRRMELGG
jgi:hypothetical protein